jgi:NitT/TauT family transport system ATP-binding protein
LSSLESQEITATNSEKIILKLKNVYKAYNGNGNNGRRVLSGYVVLDNVNLSIKQGEFMTIVGPSGCGKSTLLNIIAGIDDRYFGEMLIDGKPVSNRSTDTDRVVIFQEGALFPWLTVYENIEFGLKIAKLTKDKRNEIVMRYIDMVQLSGFTDTFVHQLSGGMRQRVAIARALSINPRI